MAPLIAPRWPFETPARHLRLKGLAMNDNQIDPWDLRTKESDLVVGGFFDRYHASWTEADLAWFEILLEEQDVDILAWAFGTAAVPPRLEGAQMQLLKKLDFVEVTK
ncbi:succinate dehydrogenase assembly factor 2 [Sandarakinorhabdus sp.]|uniref:FAD assembly factor SdhE n=1 Tax=Sandarakinorhabdus sp. TaxID=1916663 RepID=UPI0028ACE302|nr:succinate dehydrogenase assembly factor 2 [Sandarakinorhabdus sp.]